MRKKINQANIFENNHQENYYLGNGKLGYHKYITIDNMKAKIQDKEKIQNNTNVVIILCRFVQKRHLILELKNICLY